MCWRSWRTPCVPAPVNFSPYQPESRKGSRLSVFCVSPVCKCSQRLPWSSQWPVVSVTFFSLCVSGIRAQLGYRLNLQGECSSHIPQRGQRPQGTRLGPNTQQGRCWAAVAGGGGRALTTSPNMRH